MRSLAWITALVCAGCSLGQSPLPREGLDAGEPRDAALDAAVIDPDAVACQTCSSQAECGEEARCVELSNIGRVCLPTCDPEAPVCAPGFNCILDFTTGVDVPTCTPFGGLCCIDDDGDGYGVGAGCLGPDCDDTSAAVRPGVLELCNGVDDDCDTEVDVGASDCTPGSCARAASGEYEASAGSSCDGLECAVVPEMSCALYTCDGIDSGQRCADECDPEGTDDGRYCVPSAHCDAGECAPDLGLGEDCDEPSDCASGACSDGGLCCTAGDAGCVCPGGATEVACTDAEDDDCDGLVDCADPDCADAACGTGFGRTCTAGACACPGGATESDCQNGTDDDCDQLVDCADPDCATRACDGMGRTCAGGACACGGGGTEAACGDGLDGDCDGMLDCADSDCVSRICGAAGQICVAGICSCPGGQASEMSCNDGVDNDCDAMTDCADPDCAARSCGADRTCMGGTCQCTGGSTESTCDDGVDNDCDSMTDCADPDCNNDRCGLNGRVCQAMACACPSGGGEVCNDGVDNNCDGEIDCAQGSCNGQVCGDQGQVCSGGSCACTSGGTETSDAQCADGIDNDCDGATDCMDSSCIGRSCGSFGRTCSGSGSCECPFGGVETTDSQCSDGVDNDCNGQTDCQQGACNGNLCGPDGLECVGTSCQCAGGSETGGSACFDGSDNDCDGQMDCADSGCAGDSCGSNGLICQTGLCVCPNGGFETGTSACNDGIDNDCDGATDCDDSSCDGVVFDPTQPVSDDSYNGDICGSQANGACATSVFYCSVARTLMFQDVPGGYCGGSGGSNCDFHACTGTVCQQNFCLDCEGNCGMVCPQ